MLNHITSKHFFTTHPITQPPTCSGWRNKKRQREEEQSLGRKERKEEREWRIISCSLTGCLPLGLILPGSEIKSEITQLSNNVFYSYLVSEQKKSTWQKNTKRQREFRSPSTHVHTKWLRLFVPKDVRGCSCTKQTYISVFK